MKIKYILLLLAWLPLVCLAAIPDVTLYVDVTSPNPQKFAFSVRAGNTPAIVVQCVTNLTTGGAYTGFSTGWTPQLNYFLGDSASAGKTISGTLTPSTGVITFNALTNSFPAQGQYFAEIYLNNGPSPKLTIGQGQLTVTRSPSSGSFGALNLSQRVNWDLIVNVGTPPWFAGAEPAFLGSAAYNITAAMTNTWIVDSADEELLRTQFNSTSGQVTTALGTLTTNLAGEVARATNSETIISNAAIAAVSVETSRATNAETAISNSIVGVVAAETTRATNAEAVIQSSVGVASNALNIVLTNFVAQVAGSTNDILAQVDTVVTNQVATNGWFQSLLDNLSGTNSLFQSLFTAQSSTNSLFQGLFTAQAATNSAFQGQITANLTNQAATNVAFNARIGATEGYTNAAQTAYNWGNPALAGYLTATQSIYAGLTIANLSQLGTNIAGLTQGTYTGVISSVSYTGVTALVIGRTYAWGFTKANTFGTSTLSIATFSLSATAAGATSNYFSYVGTDTNLVLKLDGDGSSKSDVTGVYVQQITNGTLSAIDVNIGNSATLGGVTRTTWPASGSDTNAVWGNITGTLANQLDLTQTVALAGSALQSLPLTNALIAATNALDTRITAHTTNTIPHVSVSDRTNWNGKATLGDVAGLGYLTNNQTGITLYSATPVAVDNTLLVNAGFVRNLFNSGSQWFSTSNAFPLTADSSALALYSTTQTVHSSVTYSSVTNGQYVGTFCTTNTISALQSPVIVDDYLEMSSVLGAVVTVHPEIYYTYATNGTPMGDWEGQSQTITVGTNLYSWVVSLPTPTLTGSVYVVARLKVTGLSGIANLTAHAGGSTPSRIQFTVPSAIAASAGNITNIISTDGSVVVSNSGGPQPNLSVTNAVAGWSGYNATQQVTQVQILLGATTNVVTNLFISGASTPTNSGTYAKTNDYASQASWYNTNGFYVWYDIGSASYWLSSSRGNPSVGPGWVILGTNPIGSYIPGGAPPGSTGTVVTTLFDANVTNTWKAGYNGTNWNITSNGVEQFNTTNFATLAGALATNGVGGTNSIGGVVVNGQMTSIGTSKPWTAAGYLTNDAYMSGYNLSGLSVGGTTTITRAMGQSVYLVLTNAQTFTADTSFPTNGDSIFGLTLNGNFAATFLSTALSNTLATGTTPSYTNAWGTVIFHKGYGQAIFIGR